MKVTALSSSEYKPYYYTYINKAGTLDLLEGLSYSFKITLDFLNGLPKNALEYAYAEGKWTIKEIIQHLIDTERVFSYRALSFARGDSSSLAGFDENAYAVTSLANQRTKESLIEEYQNLRRSSINLFQSFSEDMLTRIGQASGGNLSVRAIGFILIGHETHHRGIIEERYL